MVVWTWWVLESCLQRNQTAKQGRRKVCKSRRGASINLVGIISPPSCYRANWSKIWSGPCPSRSLRLQQPCKAFHAHNHHIGVINPSPHHQTLTKHVATFLWATPGRDSNLFVIKYSSIFGTRCTRFTWCGQSLLKFFFFFGHHLWWQFDLKENSDRINWIYSISCYIYNWCQDLSFRRKLRPCKSC